MYSTPVRLLELERVADGCQALAEGRNVVEAVALLNEDSGHTSSGIHVAAVASVLLWVSRRFGASDFLGFHRNLVTLSLNLLRMSYCSTSTAKTE